MRGPSMEVAFSSRPRRLCVRRGPSSPFAKRGQSPPQFSAHVYCDQTAGWIKMTLGMELGLGPGHIVLDGDPTPPPQKWGRAVPLSSVHFYCGQTAGCIKMPLGPRTVRGPSMEVALKSKIREEVYVATIDRMSVDTVSRRARGKLCAPASSQPCLPISCPLFHRARVSRRPRDLKYIGIRRRGRTPGRPEYGVVMNTKYTRLSSRYQHL